MSFSSWRTAEFPTGSLLADDGLLTLEESGVVAAEFLFLPDGVIVGEDEGLDLGGESSIASLAACSAVYLGPDLAL